MAPLKRALRPDNANSVRMASLSALRSTPYNLAAPIIRGAVHDPDPLVAERATSLLTDYYLTTTIFNFLERPKTNKIP